MNCQPNKDKEPIIIESTSNIDSIPSGSGMAIIKDSIFIIGDDSPFLFQLSPSLQEINQYRMLEGFQAEGRIPKAIKPDFECMAEFENSEGSFLLVFGSGAMSPERDILVKINVDKPEKPEVFSLTAFYNNLSGGAGGSRATLNMEGALVLHDQLYLFNRGTNSIFVMELMSFLAYVEDGWEGAMPEFRKFDFKLPETEGVNAGFSGACEVPGGSKILFTATLEATEDWIADGEILGSYLGVLDTKKLEEGEIEMVYLVKDENGQVIKDKLESVAVLEQSADGGLIVLTVADNDDGTSKLLRLRIDRSFFDCRK